MTKQELDMKLVKACESGYPDINKIQELILAGADTNQVCDGENIFERVFLRFLNTRRQTPKRNYYKAKKIKETIQLMVVHGWDVKRFGMSVMNRFLFSTYDIWTFDLYRFMLRYDLAENPEDYDEALEGIGTEESYLRCCEEEHGTENPYRDFVWNDRWGRELRLRIRIRICRCTIMINEAPDETSIPGTAICNSGNWFIVTQCIVHTAFRGCFQRLEV